MLKNKQLFLIINQFLRKGCYTNEKKHKRFNCNRFCAILYVFGAGNLIFPGFLGNGLGSDFLLGTVGFVVTGVGLPLLAIVACSKGDGNSRKYRK